MRVGGWLARLRHLPVVPKRVDHDCFMPASRQRRLQVGADEASAASDQDHGGGYIRGMTRPRKPFRTKVRNDCRQVRPGIGLIAGYIDHRRWIAIAVGQSNGSKQSHERSATILR